MYRSKNINVPKDIHVMNKNESKLCRKLMSETGLSESEIRSHKKYRIMLSNSQKTPNKFRSYTEVRKNSLMKQATKKTGLVKSHPKTLEVYNDLLDAHGLWRHYYKFYK